MLLSKPVHIDSYHKQLFHAVHFDATLKLWDNSVSITCDLIESEKNLNCLDHEEYQPLKHRNPHFLALLHFPPGLKWDH